MTTSILYIAPDMHIPGPIAHAWDPDGWTRVRCACGHRLHWCPFDNGVQEYARFMDPTTGQQVRVCPGCGEVLGWPSQGRQERGWNNTKEGNTR